MSMQPSAPPRQLLFVLAGTGGDVWPALELASAALNAGDDVSVATYEYFESDVRARGLGFHSIGSTEEYLSPISKPGFWSRQGPNLVLGEGGHFRRPIPRILDLVSSMSESRPILICTRHSYGARFAAELHGLICVSLIYSPEQFVTPDRIPYPLNTRLVRALPHWYLRAVLRRSRLEKYRPMINNLRKPLGLPPVKNFSDWLFFDSPGLALFPAWFDNLGSIKAASIGQGDFMLRHVDETEVLDDQLERFLHAGSPPVVCTLGTGISHAAARYSRVAEVLARTGRRGVFVTPFAENIQNDLGSHIIHINYANLASLFKRASLVIHHGGIGTVSQALRAGTPQLILPFTFDQPDNGDRVRRLGAGTMIDAPIPDADVLAEAMDHSCALPRRKLESLRESALAGRGAQACLEALDELLAPQHQILNRSLNAAEPELRT